MQPSLIRLVAGGALVFGLAHCDPDDDSKRDAGSPDARDSSGSAQLAVGHLSTCALRRNGEVFCWGVVNQIPGLQHAENTPTLIPSLSHKGIRTISIGDASGCALDAAGIARCWGDGEAGTLGTGTTMNSDEPVAVESLHDVQAIDVKTTHACALIRSKALMCWGANSDRQILPEGTLSFPTPVDTQRHAVRAFGVGERYTCSVSNDTGAPTCWGDSRTPDKLITRGLKDVTKVSLGGDAACALKADATVFCWGSNDSGELGSEVFTPRAGPVQVPGLNDIVDVQIVSEFACALHRSGGVSCWGSTAYSIFESAELAVRPTRIPGIDSAVSLGVGWAHACVLTKDDQVLCWGSNDSGQLGDGTRMPRTDPKPVELP